MSDVEFVELGPALRRGIAQNKTINISKSGTYISSMSRRALGDPKWVNVSVTPRGLMRLQPRNVPNENSVRVLSCGSLNRIAIFCETEGYRMGKYAAEARDGALYVQLERVTK